MIVMLINQTCLGNFKFKMCRMNDSTHQCLINVFIWNHATRLLIAESVYECKSVYHYTSRLMWLCPLALHQKINIAVHNTSSSSRLSFCYYMGSLWALIILITLFIPVWLCSDIRKHRPNHTAHITSTRRSCLAISHQNPTSPHRPM